MMGGFLHDMNKKLAQNRALLKKSNHFKTRELYAKEIKNSGFKDSAATPDQLKSIREKVAKQRKQQIKRTFSLIVISAIMGVTAAAVLIYWVLLW